MVRDLDVAEPRVDGRREIVVDGLPLFSGAQFAVDTPWCHHCTATELPGGELRSVVRRSWKKPGEERSGLTLSSAGQGVARGWWFSPPQWEGDGLRRLPSS